MACVQTQTGNSGRTASVVRVGIIGVGTIGEDHARRLTHALGGACVTAVTDVDARRAASVASALPEARVRADAHDLICASDVDAVLVASWGPAHEEQVRAALAAGKPVFCEKPLTPTAEGSRRVVDAEMEGGRRLVSVGFMRRYDGGYRALKAALDGGRIGPALMVHNKHRNAAVPPRGFTSDMPITDSAIHELDLMRWLLGEELVAARVIAPRRTSRAAANVADPQMILLESASGVCIDVEVFVNCAYGYDIACEVVGETGTVSLADSADVAVRSAGARSEPIARDWRERFGRAYDAELTAWIASVVAGTASGASAWDGYAASVAAEACLAALHAQERIAIAMPDKPEFYA